jgi:hypothetical protein
MSPLSEQILQTVEALSAEDQQQILDFVRVLWEKRQQPTTLTPNSTPQSFFEVAKTAIGAGEGPGDLSTNTDYMQGYGR